MHSKGGLSKTPPILHQAFDLGPSSNLILYSTTNSLVHSLTTAMELGMNSSMHSAAEARNNGFASQSSS